MPGLLWGACRGRRYGSARIFQQAQGSRLAKQRDDSSSAEDSGPNTTSLSSTRLRRTFHFSVRHRQGMGALLLVAAGFLGGFTLAWTVLHGRFQESPIVVTVDRPIVAVNNGTDGAVSTPNVLGLELDEARQALIDGGADSSSIEVSSVPSAGPAEVVVIQDPPPGAPALDRILLGLSEPAMVPELVGSDLAAVRDQLDQLGAQARLQRRYVANEEEGVVLEVRPAAGEPLTPTVDLVVASAPSSAFLTELDPIESACNVNPSTIDGTTFETSLRCESRDPGSSRPVVWLMNRQVARFEGQVGQDDQSEPGATVRWVLRGDGDVLTEGRLAYGEPPTDVNVDISGVLRLEFEVTVTDLPDDLSRPVVVIGNPLLIGGPQEIESLLAES